MPNNLESSFKGYLWTPLTELKVVPCPHNCSTLFQSISRTKTQYNLIKLKTKNDDKTVSLDQWSAETGFSDPKKILYKSFEWSCESGLFCLFLAILMVFLFSLSRILSFYFLVPSYGAHQERKPKETPAILNFNYKCYFKAHSVYYKTFKITWILLTINNSSNFTTDWY